MLRRQIDKKRKSHYCLNVGVLRSELTLYNISYMNLIIENSVRITRDDKLLFTVF